MRYFQSVIGRETRWQCKEHFGGKPDIVMACVGGGSNAIGIFHEFVDDSDVRLIGVEVSLHGLGTVLRASESICSIALLHMGFVLPLCCHL